MTDDLAALARTAFEIATREDWEPSMAKRYRLADAIEAALRQAQRYPHACECQDPDPVMQADGKFYCYTCSFQTGARPSCLEPESLIQQAQRAQAERDAQIAEQLKAAIHVAMSKIEVELQTPLDIWPSHLESIISNLHAALRAAAEAPRETP